MAIASSNQYFLSFFFLSLCRCYFSPRRVYHRVLKLCMGSYVPQYIRVLMKKISFGEPPYPPPPQKKANFGGTKVKNGCFRVVGFWNFAWAPMFPNILGFSWRNFLGGTPLPPKKADFGGTKMKHGCFGSRNIGYDFLRVGGDVWRPPCRHACQKISARINGGLSRGSCMHRPGSEDPHRRERKFFSCCCYRPIRAYRRNLKFCMPP